MKYKFNQQLDELKIMQEEKSEEFENLKDLY